MIGADQVAACDSRVLEESPDRRRQSAQLLSCSGRSYASITALAVIRAQRRSTSIWI